MGPEYKRTPNHECVKDYREYRMHHKFTKPTKPQTNRKAERVIRTMTGCDIRTLSSSLPEQRREELRRFLNFYNAVKPYGGY